MNIQKSHLRCIINFCIILRLKTVQFQIYFMYHSVVEVLLCIREYNYSYFIKYNKNLKEKT